jgi:hypothetical protein
MTWRGKADIIRQDAYSSYPLLQETLITYCNNIYISVFQDIDGAKDYFKRRVSFVEEQIEKIMQLSTEKNELSKGICAFLFCKFCDYQSLYMGIPKMNFFTPCNYIYIPVHLFHNPNSTLEPFVETSQ